MSEKYTVLELFIRQDGQKIFFVYNQKNEIQTAIPYNTELSQAENMENAIAETGKFIRAFHLPGTIFTGIREERYCPYDGHVFRHSFPSSRP